LCAAKYSASIGGAVFGQGAHFDPLAQIAANGSVNFLKVDIAGAHRRHLGVNFEDHVIAVDAGQDGKPGGDVLKLDPLASPAP